MSALRPRLSRLVAVRVGAAILLAVFAFGPGAGAIEPLASPRAAAGPGRAGGDGAGRRAHGAVRRSVPDHGGPALRARHHPHLIVRLRHRRRRQRVHAALRAAGRGGRPACGPGRAACGWRPPPAPPSRPSSPCSPSTAPTVLEGLPPPDVAWVTLGINVFAFFAVAFLAGQLTREPALGRRRRRGRLPRRNRRPRGLQPQHHRPPRQRPHDDGRRRPPDDLQTAPPPPSPAGTMR